MAAERPTTTLFLLGNLPAERADWLCAKGRRRQRQGDWRGLECVELVT